MLATVVALDPMRAVFSISERTYLMVEEARRDGTDRAYVPRLRLATGEFHDQEGMFSFADNQVDEGTGTIRVYLEFPNPDLVLVPGLFVTVVLSSKETQPRILVPQAAVQLNQSGPFVLVVDADSRVQVRQVDPGERDGGDIVIASGLEAGETIIVEGIQKGSAGRRSLDRSGVIARRGKLMFSAFFIDRPKFAFVIAIVVVLVGILSLITLPGCGVPGTDAATGAGVCQLSRRQCRGGGGNRRGGHRGRSEWRGGHDIHVLQELKATAATISPSPLRSAPTEIKHKSTCKTGSPLPPRGCQRTSIAKVCR